MLRNEPGSEGRKWLAQRPPHATKKIKRDKPATYNAGVGDPHSHHRRWTGTIRSCIPVIRRLSSTASIMVNFIFEPQLRTMRCGGENAKERKSQLGSVDEVTNEACGGPSSLKLPTLLVTPSGVRLCTSRPDKKFRINSMYTSILDRSGKLFKCHVQKLSLYPVHL